ncbi:hypothetical protein Tco_1198192 [Tanacetum coccineum]
MENVNPSSFPEEPLDSTHAKFTARINKLLTIRQTIDSLLFKTINEMTNQSSDSEIFYLEERIKFAQKDDEVVFRMPQRTKELDFASSLEKDKFEAFFIDNLKVIFDENKLGSFIR